MGLDGRNPARGKRRATILAELQKHPWTFGAWPGLTLESESLFRRVEQVARRKPRFVKAGPLSTSVGLQGGWPSEPPENVDSRGISFTRPRVPAAWNDGRPRATRLIDEVPAVDLPTLARAVKEEGTLLRCFTLKWDYQDVHTQLRVDVDLRPSFDRGIRVCSSVSSSHADVGQSARIITGKGKRLRFVCPLTGRLVDTLFMRDNVLGSSRGLRLNYPSQSAELRRARERSARFAPDPEAHARYRAAHERYQLSRLDSRPLTPAEREELDHHIKVRLALLERALEGNVSAMRKCLQLVGQ